MSVVASVAQRNRSENAAHDNIHLGSLRIPNLRFLFARTSQGKAFMLITISLFIQFDTFFMWLLALTYGMPNFTIMTFGNSQFRSLLKCHLTDQV